MKITDFNLKCIRVNLGKLESNTKYTISIEGIGYLQGGSIEPITFTTGILLKTVIFKY